CYASKLNTETGSPARPTIIVEKLTVKLDAQQLSPLPVYSNCIASSLENSGKIWISRSTIPTVNYGSLA
ncbi:hypothetical protein, partial [Microcoleus sp.]|uniref:hypothetical protein n=1 Tax=Microcoleus sp. TaxID=44472 RepID=UPI00403EC51A